jgi:uncharacterized cupin superfamily protein
MSKSVLIANVCPAEVPLVPMPADCVVDGNPKTWAKKLGKSPDGNSVMWVWECSSGSFVWHYPEDETVYIISGEVFLSTNGGEERRLGPGDMAFFPGGSVYTWRVTQPVRKFAITRKDLPRPLGFLVRLGHRLVRMLGLRAQSSL